MQAAGQPISEEVAHWAKVEEMGEQLEAKIDKKVKESEEVLRKLRMGHRARMREWWRENK